MNHLSESELNRFIDNDFSLPEKEAAEKHFNECDVCSAERQLFIALHSLLKEQREITAPEGIESAIMKRISRKIKNDNTQKTFFGVVVTIFGLGIAFIVGLLGFQFSAKLFSFSIEEKIVQQVNQNFEQLKSFINVVFGEKPTQSFEITVLLFFILSLYFVIEKYKAIRH